MLVRAYSIIDMDALKTVLANSVLNLFQNDYTPNINTALGDLTVATFTGYAPVTLTAWSAPFLDAGGLVSIISPLAVFRPTASTVQNVIYGWYLTEMGGTLVSAGRFVEAPVSMGSTLNVIQLNARIRQRLAAA